jgi:hypothetical protein
MPFVSSLAKASRPCNHGFASFAKNACWQQLYSSNGYNAIMLPRGFMAAEQTALRWFEAGRRRAGRRLVFPFTAMDRLCKQSNSEWKNMGLRATII